MNKKKFFAGTTSLLALFSAISLSMTSAAFYYSGYVNSALGLGATVNQGDGNTSYYESSYGALNKENSDRLVADEKAHCIQTMEEGTVLLRNENDALPLRENERRVTFFGNSVKDPVYRTNAGQATFDSTVGGTLWDAFTDAGFSVNKTMFDAYVNSSVSRVSSSVPGQSSIGEVDISFYTEELKRSFSNDYNDVAFVFLTRYGGEGVDLDMCDQSGVPLLSLHQEEKDLLKMIKESGKFKKTIVLLNSPFAMDMEWIEREEYGIDACLVFSATGNYGFIGLANLLTGKADVTGHLADTYATDSLSAPAAQNFGDFTFEGRDSASYKYQNKYVVYAEDIYVGYKYYETRYHDQVLGLSNATGNAGVFASTNGWNYAQEMAYPFGYGLSYSDFTQEVKSIEWDREKHKVVAKVQVTNNGSAVYDGKSKSAIQLYASLPYETGQAEKSAIQLIGFAKTDAMAKGESKEYTLEVDDYLFAAYDSNAVNGKDPDKLGCYVFDAGEYTFAIGNDAHDALNNILSCKGVTEGLTDEKGNSVSGNAEKAVRVTLKDYDNTTYATSRVTGEVVCNKLKDADVNYWLKDSVTYLTRSDWNTFPETIATLPVTEEMADYLDGQTYEIPASAPSASSMTTGESKDLVLVEMREVAFDDEKWEDFIGQLTTRQLATIIGDNRGNVAIPQIGKEQNASTNGPNGIAGTYKAGNGKSCTLYPDEIVLSCTFNPVLAVERGAFYGEDSLYAGYTMVFGPGNNLHRCQYLGRNSEYYSEDGNMAYTMALLQANEMSKKGVITGFKHFALNDQETNRHGVAVFASEQACRELYLRAFEGCLSDGAGLGVMSSYNRIGLTASPACKALQTEILREEWGFQGINITDSAKDASDYFHARECLEAGTDLFLSDTSRIDELVKLVKTTDDGNLLSRMQLANKHFYYAHSRSMLINGLTKDSKIENTVYWWQPALIAVCCVFGAATVTTAALYAVSAWNEKKEKEHA